MLLIFIIKNIIIIETNKRGALFNHVNNDFNVHDITNNHVSNILYC